MAHSSDSARATDASTDMQHSRSDILNEKNQPTPEQEELALVTQEAILQGDSAVISPLHNPREAIGTPILADDSITSFRAGTPEEAVERSLLAVDRATDFLPEAACGVSADVVRDVLNQHEAKIAGLPDSLAAEVYRAQLYIQRKTLMAKSRSRLEKLLGL